MFLSHYKSPKIAVPLLNYFILLLFITNTLNLSAQDTIFVYNKAYAGSVNKIISGAQTNLLISGGGLIEYFPDNDSIKEWYIPVNSVLVGTNIVDYAYDQDSVLWLCDRYNGIVKFDENDPVWYNRKNSPLGDSGIISLMCDEFDSTGNLWIGTIGGGLIIKWHDTGWESITNDTCSYIYDIVVDSMDIVHIAARNWIITYDHGEWDYMKFREYTGSEYEFVLQILIAANGDIYYRGDESFVKITSSGYELIKLSDYDPSFRNYTKGLTENNNGDIYMSGDDGYIILNQDGTVSVFNEDSTGIYFNSTTGLLHDSYRDKTYLSIYEKGMIDITDAIYDTICIGCDELPYRNHIYGLIDHQDRIWIVGNSSAVYENGNWKYFDYPQGVGCKDFVVTADDEVLLNTYEDVWIYSNGSWEVTDVSVWTGNGGLYDMTVGRDNNVYISTKLGLFYRMPFTNYWLQVGRDKDYVDYYSIDCDTAGIIWLTHENGIGYYNPEDHQFTYLTIFNSSIPDGENYYEIKCDSIGRIWLMMDTSIYVKQNDRWKCIIPNRSGDDLLSVHIDEYQNTWLLTSNRLWFMNETDTIVYHKDDGIFANSEGFRQASFSSDGTFWVFGYGGMTGLKYSLETGITKVKSLPLSVKVYPNPAGNTVNFELISNDNNIPSGLNITITIYNLFGQTIKKTTFNSNRCSVDLNFVTPGIYLFELSDNNNRYTGKFIIK